MIATELVLHDDTRNTLTHAILIAVFAHHGQVDKGENPYIYHPMAVAARLAHNGYDENTQIVGVLHDVIEDTDVSIDMLKEEGFSDEIIAALDIVTKRSEEIGTPNCNAAYTARILSSGNRTAIAVKESDICNNMSRDRLMNVDQKYDSLMRRYQWSIKLFRAWLEEVGKPHT